MRGHTLEDVREALRLEHYPAKELLDLIRQIVEEEE
jgi:hypothetical protein